MGKRLDLPTKLTAAGLLLALLVFLFGDNVLGRFSPLGLLSHEQRPRIERSDPSRIIEGTAASSLIVLVDIPLGSPERMTALRANLADLSKAIVLAAEALPKPVLIRYVRAGAASPFGRARCAAAFDDSLFSGAASGRAGLAHYLGECSQLIAAQTPHESLPLGNAIEAAVTAAPIRVRHRIVVVISGFNEVPPDGGQAAMPTLKGLRAVLIGVPDGATRRIGSAIGTAPLWSGMFVRRGAEVTSFDTSALDFPADLAAEIAR